MAHSLAHLDQIPDLNSTNAYTHMCTYVDQKGLAAMLVIKRSAGVAPEPNLRNPLHEVDEAHKREIHPGFETPSRHHQEFKTGVSVVPQKVLVFSKFIF